MYVFTEFMGLCSHIHSSTIEIEIETVQYVNCTRLLMTIGYTGFRKHSLVHFKLTVPSVRVWFGGTSAIMVIPSYWLGSTVTANSAMLLCTLSISPWSKGTSFMKLSTLSSNLCSIKARYKNISNEVCLIYLHDRLYLSWSPHLTHYQRIRPS